MPNKLTTEDFINKAISVHGDEYDYPDEYINNRTKIRIWCKECKQFFEQTPNNHLKGHGCKKHANNLTTEDFINKAMSVHGNEYDYSSVEYIGAKHKVNIICSIHGIFEQSPGNHLQGHKCPKCWTKTKDIIYLKENLTIEEDPIKIDGEIKCKCTYCKEYFVPTVKQLFNRVYALSGKDSGENRLYCSTKCKNICPIYGRVSHYKNNNTTKQDIYRPDQPKLRILVLERDNHTCQRCGFSEDLHCHHITGVEINPIESADIDNCITLCYTCHNKAHSDKGCHYGDMKRKPCIAV